MPDSTIVTIRGERLSNDGLQIDLSGPDGPSFFACPDCDRSLIVVGPGPLVCACRSRFHAHRRSWSSGRSHYSVVRAL